MFAFFFLKKKENRKKRSDRKQQQQQKENACTLLILGKETHTKLKGDCDISERDERAIGKRMKNRKNNHRQGSRILSGWHWTLQTDDRLLKDTLIETSISFLRKITGGWRYRRSLFALTVQIERKNETKRKVETRTESIRSRARLHQSIRRDWPRAFLNAQEIYMHG